MKACLHWLPCFALMCGPAAAERPEPPAGFRIVCDGIVCASLAGQDFMYSGVSEFRWGALRVRVDGQLHVFGGVSLRRVGTQTRARGELQSIAANGEVTVSWEEGGCARSLRGRRLVIRPAADDGRVDAVILDGCVLPQVAAIPGGVPSAAAESRRTGEGEPPAADGMPRCGPLAGPGQAAAGKAPRGGRVAAHRPLDLLGNPERRTPPRR